MTRSDRPSVLERIPALLPSLLAGVSIGRTHIIVDQLRGAVEGGHLDEIVMIVLSRGDDSFEDLEKLESFEPPASPGAEPVAVALALTQPPSDAATLLHAGLVAEVDAETERRLAEQLRSRLHRVLHDRGVRFLQWATDPVGDVAQPASRTSQPLAAEDEADAFVSRWAHRLGLQPVATLRYLSSKLVELADDLEDDPRLGEPSWHLAPVDRSDPSSFAQFSQLVQRTYRETLDCQPLSQLRSAEQILSAYQHSRAFQQQWWYQVVVTAGDGPEDEAVGCLILAAHGSEPDATAADSRADPDGAVDRDASAAQAAPGIPPSNAPRPGSVMELVYMGVVPEVRGRGFGRRLITETIRIARRVGVERLILAVDEKNSPAIDAYMAAGLTPLLRETVWAASLPPEGA